MMMQNKRDSMSKREFGELEIAILQIIKPGAKLTVKEVCQLLGNKDKYNTIMTVMHRLAQKNVLTRIRTGLQYTYWLKEAHPSLLRNKFKSIKPVDLMCSLLDASSSISDAEIEEMETLLKQFKERKKT